MLLCATVDEAKYGRVFCRFFFSGAGCPAFLANLSFLFAISLLRKKKQKKKTPHLTAHHAHVHRSLAFLQSKAQQKPVYSLHPFAQNRTFIFVISNLCFSSFFMPLVLSSFAPPFNCTSFLCSFHFRPRLLLHLLFSWPDPIDSLILFFFSILHQKVMQQRKMPVHGQHSCPSRIRRPKMR